MTAKSNSYLTTAMKLLNSIASAKAQHTMSSRDKRQVENAVNYLLRKAREQRVVEFSLMLREEAYRDHVAKGRKQFPNPFNLRATGTLTEKR